MASLAERGLGLKMPKVLTTSATDSTSPWRGDPAYCPAAGAGLLQGLQLA